MTPSPLELLHPQGSAHCVLVHGQGPATALAAAKNASAESRADVVLLAPAPEERRDRAWVTEAAHLASSVAEDGLVVVPNPSRRLRAELAAQGLEPGTQLLHVPDVPQSRYVFPLRGHAARYALRRVVPLHPLKRTATRALPLPGVAALAPTSVVFRRPGAPPLLRWLCAFGSSESSCTAIVTRSWRPQGAELVYRFGDAAAPDAIAKIGVGATREGGALRDFGAAARRASANVPALLGERVLGELPVVVETPLAGSPALILVRGSPRRARNLLRAVARWLAEWNAATSTRRSFEQGDAERHVLNPARRLTPLLGDDGAYLSQLERLCNQCSGTVVPFVAAHNDLSAANVLHSELGGLGIVDWEEAEPECLPLGDLAYAAADFAAAVDTYRDWPAAFATCFESGGPFTDLTSELVRNAAHSLQLDAPVVELCFQACWLRHADNERRYAFGEGLPSFLAVLRRAADVSVAGEL